MAEDWAADVRKFVPDADDAVIAGIVRHCGIALRNRDSSLVSFGDPKETARVRNNFLKKKLGLTESDEVLDQALAAVAERMKGVNFKNRVTVYYLLAEQFGLLHLFRKGGAAAGAAAGAVAMGLAGLGSAGKDDDAADAVPDAPDAGGQVAAAAAGATATHRETGPATPTIDRFTSSPGGPGDGDDGRGTIGWLWWLLLALLLGLILWWLFFRQGSGEVAGDQASTAPVAAASLAAVPTATDLAAAPAEGSVTIPSGAGVTAETRDGKPVVKVYFDTGKTDVVPAFADAAGGLKAWLAANAGSSLAISGYNDKTGDAALNAELSKNRAKAVRDTLVAAGIAEASVELVKPAETTDATADAAAARRVEVVVR